MTTDDTNKRTSDTTQDR